MEVVNWMNILVEKSMEFITFYGPKVIGALLTFWLGSIIIRKITAIAGKTLNKSKMDSTLTPFFKNLLNGALKVLLVLSVIGILGVETTSFAAIIAAAGLAVGMALQGSLGNFAGGVLLLVFRPFEVGDVIKAQKYEGEVQQILLFVTVLKTLDNRVIFIPNGPLAGGAIENCSREKFRRVDMNFKISGNQDIQEARAIALQALQSVKGICKSKDFKPQIAVTGLTEYAIELQARPYCQPKDYYDVWVQSYEAIKNAFNLHSIKAPVPTHTLDFNNESMKPFSNYQDPTIVEQRM